MFDFGYVVVELRFGGCWTLVVWTLDVDVGCGLCGRWILVEWEWMFDFGCMDIGFWLRGRWILNAWTLNLITWTLHLGVFGGCWIL